jgi:hypothetical protein
MTNLSLRRHIIVQLQVLLLLLLLLLLRGANGSRRPISLALSHHRHWPHDTNVYVRGGGLDDGDEEEDEIEDERNDHDVVDSSKVAGVLFRATKSVVLALGKATIVTAKAMARAAKAAFDTSDQDEEEASVSVRTIRILRRMWTAALTFPQQEDAVASTLARRVKLKLSQPKVVDSDDRQDIQEDEEGRIRDFGTFLANQYDVTDERDADNSTPVLGGTMSDALRMARTQARLLVAFIPASRPVKNRKTADNVAIRSLLSQEVALAAERKSRKSGDTGSFLVWGTKAASSEATAAMKRLRAKQPKGGEKRPTLVVVYPAQVLSPTGIPTVIPRLLAQHHCSPPPSPESMAAWLSALRKRHAKQFAAMIFERREAKLFKERKEGYKSSIHSDRERREKEKREKEELLAKEKAEQERLASLEERRQELKESLPEEPEKDAAGVVTIALRFANGRSGQRRFESSTSLETVFNWVDAIYSMEREKVILTTMNGQKSFSWEDGDKTLKESGLGRLTGLRVFEKKEEEPSAEEKEEEEEEEEENDNDEEDEKDEANND